MEIPLFKIVLVKYKKDANVNKLTFLPYYVVLVYLTVLGVTEFIESFDTNNFMVNFINKDFENININQILAINPPWKTTKTRWQRWQ